MVELGVPFSDPLADGPIIQRSSQVALEKGTSPRNVLKLVSDLRGSTQVPLVLMGYYNSILSFGEAKFVDACSEAGVDGIIVVDLPPEEAGTLRAEVERGGLDLIFLLTPLSSDARIELVSEGSSGFIYCVSYAGVTGGGRSEDEALSRVVKKVRSLTKTPVEVGFGISSPQDARRASRIADGIIVGSAVIREIEASISSGVLTRRVGDMVERLAKATKELSDQD